MLESESEWAWNLGGGGDSKWDEQEVLTGRAAKRQQQERHLRTGKYRHTVRKDGRAGHARRTGPAGPEVADSAVRGG